MTILCVNNVITFLGALKSGTVYSFAPHVEAKLLRTYQGDIASINTVTRLVFDTVHHHFGEWCEFVDNTHRKIPRFGINPASNIMVWVSHPSGTKLLEPFEYSIVNNIITLIDNTPAARAVFAQWVESNIEELESLPFKLTEVVSNGN